MMQRTPMIVGNWKMNLEQWAAVELAGSIADGVRESSVEVVICPPFPWLVPVSAVLEGSRVALGAQDCSSEPSGAFTGQVSAAMLNGLCSYVIVGHSERRRYGCESNELVGRKAAEAMSASLRPIVCVGESLEARDAGQTLEWIEQQLAPIVASIEQDSLCDMVVAYEPIWAIGTGRSALPDDADDVAAAIRSQIIKTDPAAGQAVRILYGGSVTADNAATYLEGSDVDGLLVGGASLKADSFLSIVSAAS